MSIANRYGDPQERIKQLEQQLAAYQRSLDYWTEQAENAECCISRQKERIEQLEDQLRRLGACPDCGQVEQMVEGEPFSSCACGKGEDYGRRPLQQLQLIQRIAQRSYGVAYPKQKGTKHV